MKNKYFPLISFFLTFLMLIPSEMVFASENKKIETFYKMELALNDEKKLLEGKQNVEFTNFYNKELTDLVFHLYADSYEKRETRSSLDHLLAAELPEEEIGYININKVLINNKKVKFVEKNQFLKISLPEALKPNEKVDIYIDFTLKIPKTNDRLGYNGDQYCLTNWYPILSIYDENNNSWDKKPFYIIGESNYSDSSKYSIDLTLPKDIVVASTGVKRGTSTNSSSKTVSFFADNVRDFALFMNRNYNVVSDTVNGIKVNSYYVPFKKEELENLGDEYTPDCSAKRALYFACEALNFFSEKFGDYPFDEFDIAETFLQGAAMEYPTIIQMEKYEPLKSNPMDHELKFIDEAIVHEVGHQWWYSIVGNNEYTEAVLDESFTSFSTALYFEEKYGQYSSKGVKSDILRNFHPSQKKINRAVNTFETGHEFCDNVYTKGATVLQQLRVKMGEENFYGLLQDYFNEYKFKIATVEGFLDKVEKHGGKKLRDFIDNAFNDENYDPTGDLLTNQDWNGIFNYDTVRNIKYWEDEYGINLTSILRANFEDKDIHLVVPNNMDKTSLQVLSDNLKDLELNFQIVRKSELNDEILKSNLIVFDTSINSDLIKSYIKELPISINKNKLTLKDEVTFETKELSGIISIKNPNNKEKIVMSMFGENYNKILSKIHSTHRLESFHYQFMIGNSTTISGQFTE